MHNVGRVGEVGIADVVRSDAVVAGAKVAGGKVAGAKLPDSREKTFGEELTASLGAEMPAVGDGTEQSAGKASDAVASCVAKPAVVKVEAKTAMENAGEVTGRVTGKVVAAQIEGAPVTHKPDAPVANAKKDSTKKEAASGDSSAPEAAPIEAGAVEIAPGQAVVVVAPVVLPGAVATTGVGLVERDPAAGAALVAGVTKGAKAAGVVKAVAPESKSVAGKSAGSEETAKPEAAESAVKPAPQAVAVADAHAGVARHVGGVDSIAVHGAVVGANVMGTSGGGIAAKSAEVTGTTAKTVDANGSGAELKTLVATPNVLEVGVASGSHGWLRVRAEMGQMGEVTASVAAGSAGALAGLHKELPAISAYLAGERVGVSSLVVNAMEKGAGAQDAAMQAGTQGGARGQGASDERESPGARMHGGTESVDAPGAGLLAGVDFSGINLQPALFTNGSGSWLSVRV